MNLSYGIPRSCSDEGGCGNALCFSCYPDDSISQYSIKTMLKTATLATIAIITTAGHSIAAVPVVEPPPGTPITTIAVVYCPNGSTQGPRHQICIDSIAYKPAPNESENPKIKGPKIGFTIVAEGVDRDPRGGIPSCTPYGPNRPGCTMRVAIEDSRHVSGGRRGAPKGTQGGGTRLTA